MIYGPESWEGMGGRLNEGRREPRWSPLGTMVLSPKVLWASNFWAVAEANPTLTGPPGGPSVHSPAVLGG
jgi:hypothetical protein